MRRRPDTASAALDESLQADVMRFMAIIALCLVAIMALARNATPLEAEAGVDAATTVVPPAPTPPPAKRPEPALPAPVPAPTEPEPEPPASVEIAEAPDAASEPVVAEPAEEAISAPETVETAVLAPSSVPERPEEPRDVRERLARVGAPSPSRPERTPPVPAAAPAPAPSAPAAPAETPEEVGLSLRFASDGDFLRLVSREAIEVYAFREGEVLALSPGLRFAVARTPGQVHELLPSTIPTPVGAALADARGDVAGYRWGVRMPGRIERRIRDHVDAGDSGVLVIDRFGQVRLLAATTEGERKG